MKCRSSCSQIFFKIIVRKNFAIFTRKHLCWRLFLIKLQVFRPATLLKRDFKDRCFPVNIAKFLRTAFSRNTDGRLLLEMSDVKLQKLYRIATMVESIFSKLAALESATFLKTDLDKYLKQETFGAVYFKTHQDG